MLAPIAHFLQPPKGAGSSTIFSFRKLQKGCADLRGGFRGDLHTGLLGRKGAPFLLYDPEKLQ